MTTIVALVVGIIVGFVIARNMKLGDQNQKNDMELKEDGKEEKEEKEEEIVEEKEDEAWGIVRERSEQRAENIAKILEYAKDKDKVTNDEIEKMLGVSHATAFRYLDELEKEGILKQVGNTGRGVYYKKIQ